MGRPVCTTGQSSSRTSHNTTMYLAALLCVAALVSQVSSQDSCQSDTCFNGGVCVFVLGAPSCACAAGFTGDRCQNGAATSAPDNTACGLQPCLNGGSCVPSGSSFVCLCASGYTGSVCQVQDAPATTPLATSAPAGPCENSPCLNGGVCVVSGDTFTCNCPQGYIGTVCQLASINTGTTQAPQTNCGVQSNINNLGCGEHEVVFLIEYARGDSRLDVDHEGDFIKAIIDSWKVDDRNVRIGIVTYHDTVQEVIHIDDYSGNPNELKNQITALTRRLQPSGENNLAGALDYVRTTSFVDSRPGVERVVVPIVHMMPNSTKDAIIPAAQRLKDQCVTIIGVGVRGSRDFFGRPSGGPSTLDNGLLAQAVTQPSGDHYREYRDFRTLEARAQQDWDDDNCVSGR